MGQVDKYTWRGEALVWNFEAEPDPSRDAHNGEDDEQRSDGPDPFQLNSLLRLPTLMVLLNNFALFGQFYRIFWSGRDLN